MVVPRNDVFEILDIIGEYIEASSRSQMGLDTWVCTSCEWPNDLGHSSDCIVGIILKHIETIIKEGIA